MINLIFKNPYKDKLLSYHIPPLAMLLKYCQKQDNVTFHTLLIHYSIVQIYIILI